TRVIEVFPLARLLSFYSLFFLTDTSPTSIYTLSLHDALPICCRNRERQRRSARAGRGRNGVAPAPRCLDSRAGNGRQGRDERERSEEHTSELQSRSDLVCRLLLEKKKKTKRSEREQHNAQRLS